MFQVVPLPIIRSTCLYIQLQVLSTNTAAGWYHGRDGTPGSLVCRSICSYIPDSMEFHLIHDTRLWQYWLTIPEAECTVMFSG